MEEKEILVKENSFMCVATRHVVNVEIKYGINESGNEGFFFVVEDDSYKTYRTFLPLQSALIDHRLETLGIPADNHEHRQQLAKKLLTLLKLGNLDHDGRKLSILFDPLPINPVYRLRSPSHRTEGGGDTLRNIEEMQQLMQSQPLGLSSSLGSTLSSTLSSTLTKTGRGATLGYKRKVIKQILPSTTAATASGSPTYRGSDAVPRRRSLVKKHPSPSSVATPEKLEVYATEKYFGDRKLPLTIHEEDNTLLVVVDDMGIDDEDEVTEYTLYMHHEHFKSLGLSNPDYSPSLPASEKEVVFQAINEALYLEVSERDGLRRLVLRPLTPKEKAAASSSTLRRLSINKVHEQEHLIGEKPFSISLYEGEEGITVSARSHGSDGPTVDYELLCNHSMLQTMRSTTVRATTPRSFDAIDADDAAAGQSISSNNGDSSTSIHEMIVQSLQLVPGLVQGGTDTLIVRSTSPDTSKFVFARIRLFVQEKSLAGSLFEVSIFEEEESVHVHAVDKANPAIVYDLVIPPSKLPSIYHFDVGQKLATLRLTQKAELCAYIYDRLGLESKDPDAPRKLIVHKHKRSLPKRQRVVERRKILKTITPQQQPSSTTSAPTAAAAVAPTPLMIPLPPAASSQDNSDSLSMEDTSLTGTDDQFQDDSSITTISSFLEEGSSIVLTNSMMLTRAEEIGGGEEAAGGEAKGGEEGSGWNGALTMAATYEEIGGGEEAAGGEAKGGEEGSGWNGALTMAATYDFSQTDMGSTLCYEGGTAIMMMTSAYELFSRTKTYEGGRVLMISMYDEQESVRITANEIYKVPLHMMVSGQDLIALGCKSFKELTLDQRLEVCEKIFSCLELEQRPMQDSGTSSSKMEEQLVLRVPASASSRLITLLTRGLNLGAFACLVTIREDGEVITIRAEDVVAQETSSSRSKLEDRILTPLEVQELIASYGTNHYIDLTMADKLALCEVIMRWLHIIIDEDGVTRRLELDLPSRVAARHSALKQRQVVVVHSCATPLSLHLGHNHHHQSSVSTSYRGPLWRQGVQPSNNISLLHQRRRAFADVLMDVSIFLASSSITATETTTRNWLLVRAVDVRRGLETQYLALDGSICQSLFAKDDDNNKTSLALAVADRLTLLSMGNVPHLMLIIQNPSSAEVFEVASTLLASKILPRHGGMRISVYDHLDGKELMIRVTDVYEGGEFRQLLSASYLKQMDCYRQHGGDAYQSFSRAEKIALAEALLNSKEIDGLSKVKECPQSFPVAIHELLGTRFPASSEEEEMMMMGDGAEADVDSVNSTDVQGVKHVVNEWSFSYSVLQEQEGRAARLCFKDMDIASCTLSFNLTDEDAQAIGFKNLRHAMLNVPVSGPRFAASSDLRLFSFSHEPFFQALPEMVHGMMQQEERQRLRYLHYAMRHDIGNQAFEIAFLVEGPSHVRIKALDLASEQESDLSVSDALLASFWPNHQQQEGHLEGRSAEEKTSLAHSLLQGLEVDASGQLMVAPPVIVPEVEENAIVTLPSLKIRNSGSMRQLLRRSSTASTTKRLLSAYGTSPSSSKSSLTTRRSGETDTKKIYSPLRKAGLPFSRPSSSLPSARTITSRARPFSTQRSFNSSTTSPSSSRSATRAWGVPPYPLLDDFQAELVRQKDLTLADYRSKGIWANFDEEPYISYWDQRMEEVLMYFSSSYSLRKAVSMLRRQHQLTNKEALCSLAAAHGSVGEAIGQLNRPGFRKEIKLACEVVQLRRYKHLLKQSFPEILQQTPDRPQTSF